jgi:hypothetical protein
VGEGSDVVAAIGSERRWPRRRGGGHVIRDGQQAVLVDEVCETIGDELARAEREELVVERELGAPEDDERWELDEVGVGAWWAGRVGGHRLSRFEVVESSEPVSQ